MTADDRHGHDRHAERDGQAEGAGLEGAQAAIGGALALRKDHQGLAGLQEPHRLARGPRVAPVDVHREGAQQADEPAEHRDVEEPAPRHVVDGAAHGDGHERRVGVRLVIRHDEEPAVTRDVLGPAELETEVRAADGVNGGTQDVEDRGPGRHPRRLHEQKTGPGSLPAPSVDCADRC